MHRCPTSKCVLFLSTPSMRRATFPAFLHSLFFFISIHALHEEGDVSGVMYTELKHRFLSTPSMRRATYNGHPVIRKYIISIHALHEEGDGAPQALPLLLDNFYPRPP